MTPAAQAADFMVVFKGENYDPHFVNQVVENAGGTVSRNHARIGVAIIEAGTPSVLRNLRNHDAVEFVVADQLPANAAHAQKVLGENLVLVDLSEGDSAVAAGGMTSLAGKSVVTDPTQAILYNRFQWNMRRMNADDAWALGHLGDPAVTVAFVDSGLDYTHPEMVGKVDLSRSVSFVPEDDAILESLFPGAHPVADLNFHGTMAAAQAICNAFGTACVSPNATLVGVKAIDRNYATTPGRMISGVEYAVSIGADIIAIPYTITFEDRNSEENKAAILAMKRAFKAAQDDDILVITEASLVIPQPWIPVDADNDGDNLIWPAQLPKTLTIGSTGINDEFSNFNNYGESLIDITAPGGSVPFISNFVSVNLGPCSRFSVVPALAGCQTQIRYVGIIGTIPGVGLAAGLAALVDSREGGALDGKVIKDHMINTSDDLLDPGFDALTGWGRINALTAVTAPLPTDD
jgi:subtilisin family serine protease